MLLYTFLTFAAVGSVVNDSWKFAAVEICNMLHKVRDSGSADLHLLEHKMHELLGSMDAQSKTIQQLQSDLMQQKQVRQLIQLNLLPFTHTHTHTHTHHSSHPFV